MIKYSEEIKRGYVSIRPKNVVAGMANGVYLSVSIVDDDNCSSAKLNYTIYDEMWNVVLEPSSQSQVRHISGEEYDSWGISNDIKEFPFEVIANHLGIDIIS